MRRIAPFAIPFVLVLVAAVLPAAPAMARDAWILQPGVACRTAYDATYHFGYTRDAAYTYDPRVAYKEYLLCMIPTMRDTVQAHARPGTGYDLQFIASTTRADAVDVTCVAEVRTGRSAITTTRTLTVSSARPARFAFDPTDLPAAGIESLASVICTVPPLVAIGPLHVRLPEYTF
jgi:hypothetical protein